MGFSKRLRASVAAAFAVVAGLAMTLSASPGTFSPPVYWAVSSLGVAAVLVVFVAGECAWARMVENARAAGVVAP
ncbi:hypothetical protein [Mycobacterium sp. NAZ190054]|uniref:hypothetical protein n=1 Tax=Mycobacterium sp. NAZ190054 TaxID=1747766 RepID=UPI000799A630|nr:hypothetical protein [Mycobacterium sp. NAZ190054]KWX65592.1 hypothetical protein ASJ79_01100 [Mycobacterium sp. NAZ190054]